MPRGSRARVRRFSRASQMAKANMPLSRGRQSAPSSAQAWKNLRVRLGAKDRPARFQITAQFHVVVNLPVKNQVPTAIRGGHGLGSSGNVENAEATMAEADGGVEVGPFGVRTAVCEGTGHRCQRLFGGIRLVTERGEAGDSAHMVEDSGTKDGVSSEEVGGRIKIKIKFKCKWRRVGPWSLVLQS